VNYDVEMDEVMVAFGSWVMGLPLTMNSPEQRHSKLCFSHRRFAYTSCDCRKGSIRRLHPYLLKSLASQPLVPSDLRM
jgi:hypothetical protein